MGLMEGSAGLPWNARHPLADSRQWSARNSVRSLGRAAAVSPKTSAASHKIISSRWKQAGRAATRPAAAPPVSSSRRSQGNPRPAYQPPPPVGGPIGLEQATDCAERVRGDGVGQDQRRAETRNHEGGGNSYDQ